MTGIESKESELTKFWELADEVKEALKPYADDLRRACLREDNLIRFLEFLRETASRPAKPQVFLSTVEFWQTFGIMDPALMRVIWALRATQRYEITITRLGFEFLWTPILTCKAEGTK